MSEIGPMEELRIQVAPPEDPLAVYAEWCAMRDQNLELGNIDVPIPIAEMYLIRILCAFKEIPRHAIDINGMLRH